MHRLASQPGGWNPEGEGVIRVEQAPGDLVFLSAADTDIQCLAQAVRQIPKDFPPLRALNLLNLQQPASLDDYREGVLGRAKAVVVRLLGGYEYWPYGVDSLRELARETGLSLWLLPGDGPLDPVLMSYSTVPLPWVERLWRYCSGGGVENWRRGLLWWSDCVCGTDYRPEAPVTVPDWGHFNLGYEDLPKTLPAVAILFYRAHYLAGNTDAVTALAQALIERGLRPTALYVSSLRDPDCQAKLLAELRAENCQLILNTTSFALAQLQRQAVLDPDPAPLWRELDVPVFQVILSSGAREQWADGARGLNPRDAAMNAALPEVDGRLITRAVAFKASQTRENALQTEVIVSQPEPSRINWVADLALNFCRCAQTPVGERKIALILANYPNKDGRLANGVGLDTPASCLAILRALKDSGYSLDEIPDSPAALIALLTQGTTNNLEENPRRLVRQSLSQAALWEYFQTLPPEVQGQLRERWQDREDWAALPREIPIAGLRLGNIFIGVQPARGYDLDPGLNYHAPDLEPPLAYLAFYHWLRTEFGAQAFIHLGKHGNLEWLPGKSLALSPHCYPEIALGPYPHFYPFIVNDPGEGTQAKRRSHAVILDHLTPPLTRAELYGELPQIEALLDEYYTAQDLDPSRLPALSRRLCQLIQESNLHRDLGLALPQPGFGSRPQDWLQALAPVLSQTDNYLCQLKEAQIRDGLHIFGACPQGSLLKDLLLAIARAPQGDYLGITQALALDLGLEFDPWNDSWEDPFVVPAETAELLSQNSAGELLAKLQACRTGGAAVAVLEELATQLTVNSDQLTVKDLITDNCLLVTDNCLPETRRTLTWMQSTLLPLLQRSEEEITNLLRGLDGAYVPSGPSGAPTRGRAEVLPTGRNFYGVDLRVIPTETAWETGRRAAAALIDRYTQDHGEYPKTLGISIWGTSTMRTGGDDVAQVLALLGVQPVWDGPSRRVVDFEILPVSVLERPRVDVTVRVSGFFRDSFPNLLSLMQSAAETVAGLRESAEENPLRDQVQRDAEILESQGYDPAEAQRRARYRIFGSKPGAYGAGLQGLMEAQNWQTDADLARAYLNWSSYAYDAQGVGHNLPWALETRLQNLDIILHNQDNREHDLLDSDDYYQFQGGMTAAVRALTGKNPALYFGDHSRPRRPQIKTLKEELAKVYRSRVINPKWIAGARRHGYKGAFELAATVDYLFAYGATTHCVEDYLFEGVAQAYLLDPEVQNFLQSHNPWALRDMAERLLEAQQRGIWSEVDPALSDQLRAIAHQAEGVLENQGN
ncbi:MAG: cobaltochelatase subunit CobN [Cyanobacteria bacterium RI_101]|nr:cobaltochelatase subunit CobN [Cyanobacteria bacterium RI_101]